MTQEAYCSKEIYKFFREKGFEGEIHTIFDKEGYTMPAITHQMAMAWLRQTYKINIVIMPAVADKDGDGGCLYKYIIFKHTEVVYKSECLYEKYSVACDDSLKYVLENLI